MKKKVGGIISIVILIPVLLFVAGIVAQFIININAWKAAGSDYRTSPGLPSLELDAIISALFTFPEGPIAIAAIVIGIALICVLGFASLVVDTLSSASVQEALDSAGVVSVTVSEGDTLWSIAQAHCPEGVGTSELVRWIESENDLTSKTIVPGQVLLVPAGAHF